MVIANFLTDRNGVIAKADDHHNFRVPLELKNTSDWQLFQELMAQAHVIISEGNYLRSRATHGNSAQDILYQFEPGGEFEKLGELRLRAGYGKRSPDLAVMSRKLDFNIPEEVLRSDRRITIFTITALANTSQARALTTPALAVIGSGEAGAGGNSMIDYLSNEMGDRLL